MIGGLIAIAPASVTGLLAVWLWTFQASTVNTTADLGRAQQCCEQAKFDQRFDATLSTPTPSQSASDAARVHRICAEAAHLREAQRAQAASSAQQMERLQKSLSNIFTLAASQPQEQPK